MRWLGNLRANALAAARVKIDCFGTKAGFRDELGEMMPFGRGNCHLSLV